jgi:hypothetical protein
VVSNRRHLDLLVQVVLHFYPFSGHVKPPPF